MAENKERKTFKWGDQEYLIDDLLKAHMEQQNNFYDFAKAKGQYDDSALTALRAATNKRIDAVKNGESFSADGVLDGDVVDNITIQTQRKGLIKKDKYVDQDNTEWAKYYLNKLVSTLTPYQEETSKKSSWNIAEHGLNAYLTGQGLNAQDIFENYDLQDPNNTTAARSFTQRRKLLKEQLTNYASWLSGKGFDFSKNDNEWDDTFMSDLQDLITNFDKYDNNAISSRLRKFGAGDAYTTAFTSGKWNLAKSNEEIAEEQRIQEEERQNKEQEDAWEFEVNRRLKNYKSTSRRKGQIDKYIGDDFYLTEDEYNVYMNKIAEGQTDPEKYRKEYIKHLKSLYNTDSMTPDVVKVVMPIKAQQGILKTISDGMYSGWLYDPNTLNEFNDSVLAINPVTGEYEDIFIGNIREYWEPIKRQFRIAMGYEKESDLYKKNGGILKYQTGGAFDIEAFESELYRAGLEKQAKENGLSPEVQKARNRYANPDAGFTTTDKMRLAAIGADIVSMILGPITGTATGLGSTGLNFVADVAEDGLQWEDIKNLGINVGFDLLGAVPIFGDAVGTGTKILRTLGKYAPRVMTALAAYQGYKNYDGMMDSWTKLVSSDKRAKMTVQDWHNISQSIGLLTGGTRAIRNKIAQSNIKKQAKVDGAIGVNIRRKDSSDVEQIIVNGDVANKIRNADRNPEEIKKALSELDEFKSGEFEVVTRIGNPRLPWGKVIENGKTTRKLRSPFNTGEAQVTDVYDFSKITNRKWFGDLAEKLSSKGVPEIKIDHTVARQKILDDNNIPTTINNLKKELDSRKKSIQDIDQRINSTQEEIASLRKSVGDESFAAARERELSKLKNELPSIKALRLASNNAKHYTEKRNRAQARKEAIGTNRDAQLKNMQDGITSKVNQIDADLKTLNARKRYYQAQVKSGNANPEIVTKLNAVTSEIDVALRNRKELLQTYDQARNRILTRYTQLDQDLAKSIGSYNTIISNSRKIADKSSLRKESQNRYNDAREGILAENRLNVLQNRKDQRSLTSTPLRSLEDLSMMVTSMQHEYPGRGFTVESVLKSYGVNPDLLKQTELKQGGVINRNKINKFLTYAKG